MTPGGLDEIAAMGDATKEFGLFVSARVTWAKLTVENFVHQISVSREGYYGWFRKKEWPRSVVDRMAIILSFQIVRFEELGIVLLVDGHELRCSVNKWIDEKSSRLRKQCVEQPRDPPVQFTPGNVNEVQQVESNDKLCNYQFEFRGKVPEKVLEKLVALLGPHAKNAEAMKILKVIEGDSP